MSCTQLVHHYSPVVSPRVHLLPAGVADPRLFLLLGHALLVVRPDRHHGELLLALGALDVRAAGVTPLMHVVDEVPFGWGRI